MLLLKAMASRCSTAAMHVNDFNAKTGLAVACAQTVVQRRASRHPHVEGVIHRSGQEIMPCAFNHRARLHRFAPKVFPGRKLLAITEKGQPRIFNTKGKLLAAPISGARR
jgi:hypothetical protein